MLRMARSSRSMVLQAHRTCRGEWVGGVSDWCCKVAHSRITAHCLLDQAGLLPFHGTLWILVTIMVPTSCSVAHAATLLLLLPDRAHQDGTNKSSSLPGSLSNSDVPQQQPSPHIAPSAQNPQQQYRLRATNSSNSRAAAPCRSTCGPSWGPSPSCDRCRKW